MEISAVPTQVQVHPLFYTINVDELVTLETPSAVTMDELVIRVELSAAGSARGAVALTALRDEAARALQKMLGLRAKVEVVPPGTFPRTDFKARRVIDDREVFRDMSARLAAPGGG
jgi:phenylacetate-CoA ligase